jgi:hypothetical protein
MEKHQAKLLGKAINKMNKEKSKYGFKNPKADKAWESILLKNKLLNK